MLRRRGTARWRCVRCQWAKWRRQIRIGQSAEQPAAHDQHFLACQGDVVAGAERAFGGSESGVADGGHDHECRLPGVRPFGPCRRDRAGAQRGTASRRRPGPDPAHRPLARGTRGFAGTASRNSIRRPVRAPRSDQGWATHDLEGLNSDRTGGSKNHHAAAAGSGTGHGPPPSGHQLRECEHGRGDKQESVEPIQHAAMPGNEPAGVLLAGVSLEHGGHQVAPLAPQDPRGILMESPATSRSPARAKTHRRR